MIDRQAFERFYGDSQPRLQSFVQRLCGASDVAEELVQETYYRFLRSGFEGASDEERRRYLYRIAMNLVRARRVRTHEAREEAIEADPAAAIDVNAALAKLSERDRGMLWLAYVEEYSHREIAEVMGVAALSVRVLLSRARKRFVALMEER